MDKKYIPLKKEDGTLMTPAEYNQLPPLYKFLYNYYDKEQQIDNAKKIKEEQKNLKALNKKKSCNIF